MTWLIRLAVFLALFFLIRTLWHWFWRTGWKRLAAWLLGPVATQPIPPTERHGTLKRDPVCGTHVDTALAVQSEIGGEIYYFCSESCRKSFQTLPASK